MIVLLEDTKKVGYTRGHMRLSPTFSNNVINWLSYSLIFDIAALMTRSPQ